MYTSSRVCVLVLLLAVCQAKHLQELKADAREERQLNPMSDVQTSVGSTTTPAGIAATQNAGRQAMPAMQLPINQLALNMAAMQMTPYPNYPSYSSGVPTADAAAYGLQKTILPLQQMANMAAVHNFNHPLNNGLTSNFMLANLFANGGQAANNLAPTPVMPNVDSNARWNNFINMGNLQGLGTAMPAGAQFPQAALQPQLLPYPLLSGYLEPMPNLY